jgi:ADP-ribose pyrophosphatase YjhB (NUDIX family)
MADNESYLLGLRRLVGSRLLLSPAAQMVVVDADERILYERRGDNGLWGIPSGAAEPGSSFASTAVAELREEIGLIVDEADLVAFGTLSEPDLHTFTYPNGHQLQAFSLMFEVRSWTGELRPDLKETMEAVFAAQPPGPMFAPSAAALRVYAKYRATGRFQSR